MSNGYLTSKARQTGADAAGWFCVAVEAIAPGEIVAAFGGRCLTRDEFDLLPAHQQVRGIQVDENLYLSGAIEPEPSDFINHSCRPNCGMRGNTVIVALRDIEVGETLAYDYAMSDGSDYNEFECTCGTELCRGKITGNDWMLPELQLRYRGSFSPYLAARIAALVSEGAERRAFAY
jgi:hypothetical protein